MVNGEIPDNWVAIVKQIEEHRSKAGNDLTHLWASRELNPFNDDEEMEEVSDTELESTLQKNQ